MIFKDLVIIPWSLITQFQGWILLKISLSKVTLKSNTVKLSSKKFSTTVKTKSKIKWKSLFKSIWACISLIKMSVVFFFLLSCICCLYILEINPLSVASCSDIFSYSEGCLCVWFMVSFAEQKFLSLIRSCLFLLPLLQEVGQKRSCCNLCQRVYYLCFLLSFIVSGLTFKFLIHFEFIFVYGIRKSSISFFYI